MLIAARIPHFLTAQATQRVDIQYVDCRTDNRWPGNEADSVSFQAHHFVSNPTFSLEPDYINPSPQHHQLATMIPCIIAALFITGAICIPLFMLVAPMIIALTIFAAKVTMVAIPVIILFIIFLAVQKGIEEERAREAARIAEVEQQRLRRQRERERELEAARLRAVRQAEAARRAAVPRLPAEYPPGAGGWFMRVLDTIATASAGSSSISDYDPQPVYNAPYTLPRVVAPPSATPAATTTADPATGGDCAVCCDRAADTLLMPCKHLALCGMCWARMNSVKFGVSGVRCPFCRGAVVDKITVFRN